MKHRKQMSKTDIEFCNIISFIIAIIYFIAAIVLVFHGNTEAYIKYYDYLFLISFFFILGTVLNYMARNTTYNIMFNNITMIIYAIDFVILSFVFLFSLIAQCFCK